MKLPPAATKASRTAKEASRSEVLIFDRLDDRQAEALGEAARRVVEAVAARQQG